MLYLQYIDDEKKTQEVILNERYIMYCGQNKDKKSYTDIVTTDSIFTVPYSIMDIYDKLKQIKK